MTEEELKDEREQAVKRGGEIYADHYMEGLLDGLKLALRQPAVIKSVCDHSHWNEIWTKGKAWKQCLKCGKRWKQTVL